MPWMDKIESRKWGKVRPNCDVCGQFVGIGGHVDFDCGVDGMGPTTVDGVLCKKHATIEYGTHDELEQPQPQG